MSNKQIQLRELILSLNTAERKYYKKFISREEESTHALKLFDLYIKHPNENEELIKEKAVKLLKVKNYASIKQKLFHSICDVMCYYHRDTKQYFKPYHDLQKINFLFTKDLRNEAARYAHELRHELYNSPVQVLIPTLYGIELFMYQRQSDHESFYELLHEFDDVVNIIKGIDELHYARTYLWAKGMAHTLKVNENSRKILLDFEKKFNGIYNKNKQFHSAPAKLNLLTALMINKENSVDDNLQITKEILQLNIDNRNIFSLDAYLYSLHNYIYYAIMSKNFSIADEYLDVQKNLRVLTQTQNIIKHEDNLELNLFMYAIKEQYGKINEAVDSLKTDAELLKIKFSYAFKAVINSFQVFANLFTGKVNENKKIILQYASPKLKKTNPALVEVYRILEIMTLIELKDYDLVTFQLRNAKLAFSANITFKELLHLIEALKNILESNSGNKNEVISNAERMRNEYYLKNSAHLFFQSFDCSAWIRKQLNN